MFAQEIKLFGFFPIHLYGVMIAIGLLACFFVLFEYGKYLGISADETDFVFYNGIVAIVIGFLGAAVWQATYNYIDAVKKGETPVFDIKNAGITVIGGLIVGAACFLLGAYIFRKKHYYLITRLVVFAPCCITVAHAFGRIGCFFGGCCYGKPAEGFFSFLGVVFKPGSAAYSKYGSTPLYPTQLFEAAFLFILFGVLSYLALKKNYKYNMVVYMVAYGVWRFFIEFLRADDRGSFIGSISPSQTQSIIIVLAAVGVYFILRYLNKKMEADLAEKERLHAAMVAESANNAEGAEADNSNSAEAGIKTEAGLKTANSVKTEAGIKNEASVKTEESREKAQSNEQENERSSEQVNEQANEQSTTEKSEK